MGKKAQFRVSYILLYQLIIGLVVSALLLIVSLDACVCCLVDMVLIMIVTVFVKIRFIVKRDKDPFETLMYMISLIIS